MKKFLYITILVFITASFTVSKRIEALIQKEVKSVFSVETYQKQHVPISKDILASLPQKITDNNFYKVYTNKNVLGYYYFGQAYGKADFFDFIVIFDKDLIVSKVKVLVYREDHGGEVRSKRWLTQFNGKSKTDNLTYQKDIAAISGATISAKSITNEINKLLKTVQILHKKQVL